MTGTPRPGPRERRPGAGGKAAIPALLFLLAIPVAVAGAQGAPGGKTEPVKAAPAPGETVPSGSPGDERQDEQSGQPEPEPEPGEDAEAAGEGPQDEPGETPGDTTDETRDAAAGMGAEPVKREQTAPRGLAAETGVADRDRRGTRDDILHTSKPGAGTIPRGPRLKLSGEIGFAASGLEGATGYWISPLLGGWLRVEDTIAISVDWGLVSMFTSPDPTPAGSEGVIGLGNPFIGVHSVRQHDNAELRIGVGMSIPVATLSDTNSDAAWDAYYGAMGMRGMWQWWLWVPDSISLAIPVEWDADVNGRYVWGGSVSLATTVILPKPDRSTVFLRNDTRTADLMIPFGLYGGYRLGIVTVGGHLQNVFIATGKTELQLSISPYTRIELGRGHLDGRFTVNVDKPMGFAFSDRGFWGVHLGGGYGFF